jgi:hypothetical protein
MNKDGTEETGTVPKTEGDEPQSGDDMAVEKKWTGTLILFCILLILSCPAAALFAGGVGVPVIVTAWLGGAAALGVLSGFTTGASEHTGTASEFLKFLSGGVVVPLLGGLGAMIGQAQQTTESFVYDGEKVLQHVTQVGLDSVTTSLYPLGVFGGFLLAYSLSAVLGIILGAKFRVGGISIRVVK